MIVSYNWLREFIDTDISAFEVAKLLTEHGLEIGKVDYLGDMFSNVVAAKILKIEKHPDADKLSLCKVNDGTLEYSVVCGAKNIFEGAFVPFAKIGANLPNDFVIKKTKIRGVESFGMLCSEKELGLSEEAAGIMILPKDTLLGENIIKTLDLDDYIFEIEITPNRGDCLSMLGVARELSAILGKPIRRPVSNFAITEKKDNLEITIESEEKCMRYLALVVDNINVGESPLWLKNKLRKTGYRPINNIVDITNYVLFETGHPLHAFDYSTINEKIIVRDAKVNEKITTLDGEEIKLEKSDLVIADKDKPIALAGIMGGINTGVTKNTRKIVLESAYFSSLPIRKTSKRLNFNTDSSYRFERGVCWEGMEYALKRTCALIKDMCSDSILLKDFDMTAEDFVHTEITLRKERVEKIAGFKFQENIIADILMKLSFEVKSLQNNQYKVTVPSYRNDIKKEIDLIEEILRLYGYNNIEEKQMTIVPSRKNNKSFENLKCIRSYFTGSGFSESRNYNFFSKKYCDMMQFKEDDPRCNLWAINNPLSEEEEYLVTTRVPRLITNSIRNLNYMINNVKLFEIGKCFKQSSFNADNLSDNEWLSLAGTVTGYQNEIYWQEKKEKVDFYYVSGIIEGLLKYLGIRNWNVKYSGQPYLDSKFSADIFISEQFIGSYGRLDKKTASSFGLKVDMYVWELQLDKILELKPRTRQYTKYPSYPMVERDLSLLVPDDINADTILQVIQKAAGSLLKDNHIFDVYYGKPLAKNIRNISFRLYFQAEDRTFSDKEINNLQVKILKKLSAINVSLRE